jgi:hypothetical protein
MKHRNYLVAPLAFSCLLFISASHGASNDGDDVSIGQVKSALNQKNFGEASILANDLTAANPNSADAWLIAADANMATGERFAALAALEHAMNNGLRDPARLDEDPYLDSLRSSSEYQGLLVRFGLAKSIAQAGNASITETPTGTVVRAGDVSVTLPGSK